MGIDLFLVRAPQGKSATELNIEELHKPPEPMGPLDAIVKRFSGVAGFRYLGYSLEETAARLGMALGPVGGLPPVLRYEYDDGFDEFLLHDDPVLLISSPDHPCPEQFCPLVTVLHDLGPFVAVDYACETIADVHPL